MNKKEFLFFVVMALSVCDDVLAMKMGQHSLKNRKHLDVPMGMACDSETNSSADDAINDLCEKLPRLYHDKIGDENVEARCSFCNMILSESFDDFFTFACGHDIQDTCLFNMLLGSSQCPRCHAVVAHSDLMGLVQGGRVDAVVSMLKKYHISVEAAGMALIYAAFLNKSDVACAIIQNAALSSTAIQKALEIAIRDGDIGFISAAVACCESQTEILDNVLRYAVYKQLGGVFPGLLKFKDISSHAVTEALFISLESQQHTAFFNLCQDWRVSEDVLKGAVRIAVDTAFITPEEAQLFFEPSLVSERESDCDENCKRRRSGDE